MTKPQYKKCPRCSGTGVYSDRGICFGCMGAGKYIADPFERAFSATAGDFFGITFKVGEFTFKQITRAASAEALANDMIGEATFAPITEDQARKFFKRYGDRTQV